MATHNSQIDGDLSGDSTNAAIKSWQASGPKTCKADEYGVFSDTHNIHLHVYVKLEFKWVYVLKNVITVACSEGFSYQAFSKPHHLDWELECVTSVRYELNKITKISQWYL